MTISGRKLLLGCAVTGGVFLVGILAIVLAVAIGIETGRLPDSAAKPIGKIHPRQLKQLVQMGVIEPDENVLYFYSGAMFSIRGDGNLFTGQRVISYQENEGQLEINDATYSDIASLDYEPSDSWMDDSTIIVTLDDESWFVLYVSRESNSDKTFFEKLTETWKKRTTLGRRD